MITAFQDLTYGGFFRLYYLETVPLHDPSEHEQVPITRWFLYVGRSSSICAFFFGIGLQVAVRPR